MRLTFDVTQLEDFLARLRMVFGINATISISHTLIVTVKGNRLTGIYALGSDIGYTVEQIRREACRS